MKIRRTIYDVLFPENSPEWIYTQTEAEFYTEMETMGCYWDDVMGLYYTPDDTVSYEILQW